MSDHPLTDREKVELERDLLLPVRAIDLDGDDTVDREAEGTVTGPAVFYPFCDAGSKTTAPAFIAATPWIRRSCVHGLARCDVCRWRSRLAEEMHYAPAPSREHAVVMSVVAFLCWGGSS